MNIEIFSKHIELNSALREFIQEKIGSLEKYLAGGSTSIRMEISRPSKHHRSGEVFYAEGNLKLGGKLMRATSENTDLHTAIIAVRDELQVQIKKFKEKRKDLARKPKK